MKTTCFCHPKPYIPNIIISTISWIFTSKTAFLSSIIMIIEQVMNQKSNLQNNLNKINFQLECRNKINFQLECRNKRCDFVSTVVVMRVFIWLCGLKKKTVVCWCLEIWINDFGWQTFTEMAYPTARLVLNWLCYTQQHMIFYFCCQ